jgi:hypothetical protein
MKELSLIASILGFVFIIPAIIMYILYSNKKKKILKYKHTTGIITSTAYNGFNYNNGMDKNIQFGIGNAVSGMTHRVYEYEVNGVKYSRAESVAVSGDIVKKDLGKNVDVYYDESDPNKSVIKIPGKKDEFQILSIVFFSISIFFIILGLILFIIL